MNRVTLHQGHTLNLLQALPAASVHCVITSPPCWTPTCRCPHTEADLIPATVLDPFSGTGRTCLVAAKLQRDAIGMELIPDYLEMSRQLLTRSLGMLADVEVK